MRLEDIVIHGFKSFAEKTSLRILPGITCVVGPNGCGKSNVADAVRWALGEQSPKTLRGHRMEDVIFHGSASRKPVGLAEVTLRFNNDGGLDVPWSEVEVARRLYRTGDSEYYLNRNVSRLRDIQDLFAGTGVNPKAYALMDQERLNHVLTAKPWERRIFIEEAAGIARYKQQRAETQGKLDATRQNLQRVRDVMDEVRRQLGSLERQARKAQHYKALHQEKQGLALAMVAATFATSTAEHAALATEMERFRLAEEGHRTQIASLSAREALQAAAIQDTEHRLTDLRQSVQKVQGELERLLERREQMGIQIRETVAEDVRLSEEIRALADRRQGLETEREQKANAIEEARARRAALSLQVGDLDASLEACRAELRGRHQQLETIRLEQVRVAGERAELTRSVGGLRERGLQLDRQRERLEGEIGATHREAETLAGERRRVEGLQHHVATQLSLLESEREEVERALADHEGRRAQADVALADLRLKRASLESVLEALERLEREREGYGAGVRAVFSAEGGSGLAGIVGTVADLLDVPAGLEAAVEAVLGDRVQWVVVERFEHARAALGYLERVGAGAANFLPLETIPADGESLEDLPGVRWAARLVGGARPALLKYLLGRVGVVPHLDQAEALWRRNGVVATYVTPAGHVLWPTGRLTGGGRPPDSPTEDHSILRRRRVIRQFRDDLAILEGEAEAARATSEAHGAEVASLRARLSNLASSVHAQAAARLTGAKDLESVLREEERARRHLETLTAEREQLAFESAETTRRLEDLDRVLAAARGGETSLDRALDEVRGAVERGQQTESEQLGELTARRVELAGVSERADALLADTERLRQLEGEFTARFTETVQRQGQLVGRRQELVREVERADLRAREVAADRDRLEAEVTGIAHEHQRQVGDRQSLETERRTVELELHRLVSRLHELDLRATEGRVRREELLQEARRSHAVDGSTALLALHDPARDLDSAKSRHDELAARLEAMGAVNLVADEEYRELEERLAFLRTQYDDLVGSVKDLDRALRGMTKTAQERFEEAFRGINRHFGELFARLFEGGRAELTMVAPEEGTDEDPLELGVELMAQPRGKRLQAVTLMSGGEKALTGLALLFAIFYYRPSPFCVLDEVDAPLDDANIHRFLRVLRELCGQTQFIVITHNRKTMEAADILYGVTMEEPGLSQIVSVRLGEA